MPSDKIKRQRKRKRVDTDGDPEFQVAPMVDVLLVLMLFFMSITSTELLKKDKNIVLPDASNGKKPEAKDTHKIVVNVGWNKQDQSAEFSLDGRPFASAADMTGALGARHKDDPRAFVLVRADKDVEYSNIADVMTSCAGAGIDTVTFAVITGAKKPGDTAAPAAASQ